MISSVTSSATSSLMNTDMDTSLDTSLETPYATPTSVSDFIVHAYKSFRHNHRNIFTLFLSFCTGFAPVLLWLTLFKNAQHIPTEWRPEIIVKWLPLADEHAFHIGDFSSYVFYFAVVVLAISIHKLFNLRCLLTNDIHLYLFIGAWPLLNLINYFAHSFQTSSLDIISYISYVLLHLIVPIVTGVYLYVFQNPGVLALYSWCLGTQNILGLSTHLLLPSSPPWFIHLNGINATADYSTLGYAAGLTRIDASLGTNLATNGFHKSPIVFGAFPSLHSAMAVMTCLFITWFSASKILKAAALSFVACQWWATIYLDHHWRLDLFAGMCYAFTSFTLYKALYRGKFANAAGINTGSQGTPKQYIALKQEQEEQQFDCSSSSSSSSFDLEMQVLSSDGTEEQQQCTSTSVPSTSEVHLMDAPFGQRLFYGTRLESFFAGSK
jgi:hypothetical protein